MCVCIGQASAREFFDHPKAFDEWSQVTLTLTLTPTLTFVMRDGVVTALATLGFEVGPRTGMAGFPVS